ncbi:hypothetical protein D3C72_1727380 [compost metagenome]
MAHQQLRGGQADLIAGRGNGGQRRRGPGRAGQIVEPDDGHLAGHGQPRAAALEHGALRQIVVAEKDRVAIGMPGVQVFHQRRPQADRRLFRRHDFQRSVVQARIPQCLPATFAAAQRTRVQLSPDDADAAGAALHQVAAGCVAGIELRKPDTHAVVALQRLDRVDGGNRLRAQQVPDARLVVDAGQDQPVGRMLQVLAQQRLFLIR